MVILALDRLLHCCLPEIASTQPLRSICLFRVDIIQGSGYAYKDISEIGA